MDNIITKVTGLKNNKVAYDNAMRSGAVFRNKVHIVGVEFDGTVCFRKGTRNGPNAIRSVSNQVECYSPYLDKELIENSFVDLGNIFVEQYLQKSELIHHWQKATNLYLELLTKASLNENNVKFLTLGGEHSVSYAPIKSYLENYPDLVIIHLDAHADLRSEYEGYEFSHASIMRRVTECMGGDQRLIQYGIRSGTRDEFELMRKNKTLMKDLGSFLQVVNDISSKRPIYLSLDLDYFDPAYLPGTGTPEPGGEDFHSFIDLIKILDTKNFVGADIVELAPRIDLTNNSSTFAATVAREIILTLMN